MAITTSWTSAVLPTSAKGLHLLDMLGNAGVYKPSNDSNIRFLTVGESDNLVTLVLLTNGAIERINERYWKGRTFDRVQEKIEIAIEGT